MRVSEATHNEIIQPNHVYIAPARTIMELVSSDGHSTGCALERWTAGLGTSAARSMCCSDRSRRSAGKAAVGAILTGMGKDGAEGMFEMRQAGAHTRSARTRQSSLIYGMPRVARSSVGAP